MLRRAGRNPDFPILPLTAHVHESQLDNFLNHNNNDPFSALRPSAVVGRVEGRDKAAGIFISVACLPAHLGCLEIARS